MKRNDTVIAKYHSARSTALPQIAKLPENTLFLPFLYHAMKPLLKIGFLVASVLLFASVTAAYQITLAWDANTESDLEGYILYRSEWSPCPPYDYIDSYPVTELADPLNPRCKVTRLKKDVIYYFVVTAYDAEGNESDFSNIVSSKGQSVYCPSSRSNGADGGGCMITTSACGFRWAEESLAVILLLILVFIGFAYKWRLGYVDDIRQLS